MASRGNPTRLVRANELMKKVKKKEVRKKGTVPSTSQATKQSEFVELIQTFCQSNNNVDHFILPAYFILQYNLIAWVYDIANYKMEDLYPNSEYDFILQSKMGWSKNVQEEQDALHQVLIGAMDPTYCVLLTLASHLEQGIQNGHLNGTIENGLLFNVSKVSSVYFLH